ncbi:MAG: TetR/AcrR family transcriptional regulator [Gammaproteobacteria bacterium]|nr:TetR/AcrR family transcriptional regulator [Gammaproteobacteria bacterium]
MKKKASPKSKPAIKSGNSLRGERLRQKLLETGGRLIAERSLAQISVEDILAEVGISRRTFYRYFESKYELAAHIINPALEAGAQMLTDASQDTSQNAVPGIIDCYLQLWSSHQVALNIISAIEPEVLPYLEESHNNFGSALKTVLSIAEDAGGLRNNSAEYSFKVISRTAVPLLKVYAGHPELERLYRESMTALLERHME